MAIFRRRTVLSGRNWGMLVLAVWLILQGIVPLLNIRFNGLGMLEAVLAIVAGILILLGK
ncbi:MAG: hypothetical protein KC944_08680 [Candidatus Omnitrophica bacterium]|nr:hypothetical protein [Candidatus Omnitrophota bacterium]